SIDKTGRYQFAFGIDGSVNRAFEILADIDDPVAFVDDHAVMDEAVTASLMTYDPARRNRRTHISPFPFRTGRKRQPPAANSSRPRPRTDHDVKRVSSIAKIVYMLTPIALTTSSAANTSGTLKFELAISITFPMPLLPAMISAMTVPTNDNVMAIFSEAKK